MATREEIVRFDDPEPPRGASPWVDGAGPGTEVAIVDPDPTWPEQAAALVASVRDALGDVVLSVEHVGSTSVPALAAKPIIDLLLVPVDPADESLYVPPLEAQGFTLVVREPWWHEHRVLRHAAPRTNLHVHSADSPEAVRMPLFRDWLRAHDDDRERYAAAKRDAAAAATAAGEHVMQYNARKQAVVRDIYDRAFRAAGLLHPDR